MQVIKSFSVGTTCTAAELEAAAEKRRQRHETVLPPTYQERVKAKFPLQAGCRELEQNDTATDIYCRIYGTPHKLICWDGAMIEVSSLRGLQCKANACWYVTKS